MTGEPTSRACVEVLAAGVVFADLVFEDVAVPGPGQESFARAFGFSPGAAANQAVAAARLGSRTGLAAVVGDDAMGHLVRDWLGGIENLDLSWLTTRAGLTTPVSAALAHGGDRSFVSYLGDEADLLHDEAGDVALPRAGALNVGVSPEPATWVCDLVKDGTRVVMSTSWDPTGRWDPAMLGGLRLATAFVLNEVEALSLTRRGSVRAAADALLEHVGTVIVTRGANGALLCDHTLGDPVEVPGVPVALRDPTGAGDVFIGAWLASEGSGLGVRDRTLLSVLASALSVRDLGGAASAPTTRQILEHVRSPQSGHDFATIEAWLAGRSVRHDAGSRD